MVTLIWVARPLAFVVRLPIRVMQVKLFLTTLLLYLTLRRL